MLLHIYINTNGKTPVIQYRATETISGHVYERHPKGLILSRHLFIDLGPNFPGRMFRE